MECPQKREKSEKLTQALWMFGHTTSLKYPRGWPMNQHFQQRSIYNHRNSWQGHIHAVMDAFQSLTGEDHMQTLLAKNLIYDNACTCMVS